MIDLKQKIEELSQDYFDELVHIRNHLHKYPELSFREFKTSEYIRTLLDEWGITYNHPFVETGILARIDGKQGGKVIALRSDMDALPVTETVEWENKSANKGIMHACGHDIHMASMLGSIRILNKLKDQINGRVLFVFQPGEEKVPGGARLMLEEGIFNEVKPDMIIAQHVFPSMITGKAGFRAGRYMASSDEIYLTVTGKGGHGALPENINDPVLMGAHILISLQQEINRKAPKDVPTVLSFGKFIADGAVNIIPNQVQIEGTFRTMNERWRNRAHELIVKIAKGIAYSMDGECKVEIKKGYPVLYNDEKITAYARRFAIEFLGKDHVEELDPRMTAEDFAWFANAYPAMMYRLGVKSPNSKEEYALHTPEFRADDQAVRTGASLL
ncbi:MAG TPA: amidohydrolase, partial [Bacteroidaceae bacterium]|nr:amidohydrolase [Bacteroidaceae bacterium]